MYARMVHEGLTIVPETKITRCNERLNERTTKHDSEGGREEKNEGDYKGVKLHLHIGPYLRSTSEPRAFWKEPEPWKAPQRRVAGPEEPEEPALGGSRQATSSAGSHTAVGVAELPSRA